MINGKKTYLACAALAGLSLYQLANGDIDFEMWKESGRSIELVGAGLGASLRHAVSKLETLLNEVQSKIKEV